MKRYVLGNYELSSVDIALLKDAFWERLTSNEEYLAICTSEELKKFYEIENSRLNLILDELKRYGD